MRVLFVDDNEMNRKVIKSMLESAGVEMTEAEDGEVGLSLIEIDNYDLILTDLRMPGVDGFTLIRRLRSRSDVKAALPVIVVTADHTRDLRSRALAAGADDLLLKPVSMQALFDTIARVLTRGDRQDALLA